eukprot:COSAG01_NODE_73987_length_231_cov_6.265152_1_plen_68_part_01
MCVEVCKPSCVYAPYVNRHALFILSKDLDWGIHDVHADPKYTQQRQCPRLGVQAIHRRHARQEAGLWP